MSGTPKPARIVINRAPVLTLWAAVVAERLGHDRAAALTLGRAVAGVNAQSKGRTLGIFDKAAAAQEAKRRREEKREELIEIELLGRTVRAKRTKEGLRALDRGRTSGPEPVAHYLESKFGEALDAARDAMKELAESIDPADLASRAFELYEKFRPEVPAGSRGWGAAGELDLAFIRSLAKPGSSRAVKPPGGPASARGPSRAKPSAAGSRSARRTSGGTGATPSSASRAPASPRARATRRASGASRTASKRRV